MNRLKGKFSGAGKSFGIVVSRFNNLVTDKLLDGAVDALTRHGVSENNIRIAEVPGTYDMPLIVRQIATLQKYNGIICLGAIIQGTTEHHHYIASDIFGKLSQIALDHNTPISLGILTCGSVEQAIERAGTKMGNKGFDAAITVVELSNLLDQLSCQAER